MKKSIFWLTGLALPLLFGCATTPKPTLKPNQCQTANWQNIGYQDGLLGLSKSHLNKHQEACLTVIADDWQKGYEQGLKKYCTPLRAYQLGREGFAFNNVCPTDLTLDLLKAHDEGYAHYQRERVLEQLYDDWYPFGYGRFGYPYNHFYNPRHYNTPTLPKYVD